MRLKIWRLEELKVFNSLKLSIEVTKVLIDVLTDVLADVLADIATDVTADIIAEAVAGLGYYSRGLDTN